MRRALAVLAGLLVWVAGGKAGAVEGVDDVYLAPDKFLSGVFSGDVPKPKKLWIKKDIRKDISRIMGRGLGSLRVTYWRRDGRTAWILEEIGKVHPITTGLVVQDGALEQIRVLIYRESRGWEVRYDFFTEQFKGARLTEKLRLDRGIDGIAGATLSVGAMTRLGALALYLHRRATEQ